MTVKEIQSVLLGYELSSGEEVIDLYFENQSRRIVLEAAKTPIAGKRKLYFQSKIELLDFLFRQHK